MSLPLNWLGNTVIGLWHSEQRYPSPEEGGSVSLFDEEDEAAADSTNFSQHSLWTYGYECSVVEWMRSTSKFKIKLSASYK